MIAEKVCAICRNAARRQSAAVKRELKQDTVAIALPFREARSHGVSLTKKTSLRGWDGECRPLDLEQLRSASVAQRNKRGRSM
jgi:hypothetical protein